MRDKIINLLLAVGVVTLSVMAFTSCTDTPAKAGNDKFIQVYSQGNVIDGTISIYVDTETGAEYIVAQCNTSITITPRYGRDAKLYINSEYGK